MNYAQATRYLISLGNEVRASASDAVHVAKLGLENVTALLEDLGRPQDAVPSVLVAGTNGKGSTAAMLDAVLQAASLRCGLYTSPHLVEINERIQISGVPIPPEEFAALFDFLRGRMEAMMADGRLRFHPTYFECLTAMGMEHFRRQRCELAVLEVGMGGRLDATNTATSRLGVITEIDLDHERFLGHTIPAIAAEKAGIIKPGGVTVSAAAHPEAAEVIRQRAMEQGARLVEVRREYAGEDVQSREGRYSFRARHADGLDLPLRLSLRGRHQVDNALAAVAAARELARMGFPVTEEHIRRGVETARWPGRLELLQDSPTVFLDGAHNPSSARAVARFWEEHFAGRRLILVYGAMRDKAVPEITEILFPLASAVVLTRPDQDRATAPETLLELTGHLNRCLFIEQAPEAALRTAVAMAAPGDVVLVTGSLFLVGDIKKRWAAAPVGGGGPPAEPLPVSISGP